MDITKEQWKEAIEHLFEDEVELKRKIRAMNSIDSEAAMARIQWIINNKWHDKENDGIYTNEITGEVLSSRDLILRYQATLGT